jgi:splicing suppressor protein 51
MASRLRPVLAPALRILPRTAAARVSSSAAISARRTLSLKSFFTSRKPATSDPFTSQFEPVLEQADLFHPLSKSPLAPVRAKADWIASHGTCPVCKEQHAAEEEAKKPQSKPPTYECPDCGYPTHCSEEHYKMDKEHHKHVCGTLREVNEDEHDLRSGRRMKEFEFPGNKQDRPFLSMPISSAAGGFYRSLCGKFRVKLTMKPLRRS